MVTLVTSQAAAEAASTLATVGTPQLMMYHRGMSLIMAGG
jgi:hypothetical protein